MDGSPGEPGCGYIEILMGFQGKGEQRMEKGGSVTGRKKTFAERMKSREAQQFLVIVTFLFAPLLLLIVFTYLPFMRMVQFSFTI